MKERIWDELVALLVKWGFISGSIFVGALTQLAMSNKKNRLSIIENIAIFLSCCLVGGIYAVIAMNHGSKVMVSLSGLVTIMGYNLVSYLIVWSKNPEKIRDSMREVIKRLFNIK